MAVMFLPHGDPPPDTHEAGQNILPEEGPEGVIEQLDRVSKPLKATTEAPQVTKTALQEHTTSLPGDVPIARKDQT
jgi:hypothetical protein